MNFTHEFCFTTVPLHYFFKNTAQSQVAAIYLSLVKQLGKNGKFENIRIQMACNVISRCAEMPSYILAVS